MTHSHDHSSHAWKMMKDMDICMFVTMSTDGPRARPMSSIVREEDGVISFLTDRTAAKDEEIRQNPQVCLAYSDGGSNHVSVTGHATLDDDRSVIEELWSPGAQAFWPAGPSDPNIVAIHVQPSQGEIWDGPSGLVAAAKFAFAIITKTRPAFGVNEKVVL